MAVRTLYLVRHGEYDWDRRPRPTGLTPLGRRQARRTARRLASVPATALYCSDSARAIETADHIARACSGLQWQSRRILRECWLSGFRVASQPPRRVIRAEMRRAARVFEHFVRPTRGTDKHEIIVAHGNLIRYLVSRVLTGSEHPHWVRMRTLNCAISEIVIGSDGRATLVSYNDVGHLPRHQITLGVPTQRPGGR